MNQVASTTITHSLDTRGPGLSVVNRIAFTASYPGIYPFNQEIHFDGKFEVQTASFAGVQKELKDLAFSVTPLVKQKLLSAYEILGASYCQLEGQQAAHMQVRNRRTGTLCTLYVASLKGPLAALKSTDKHVDLEANKVEIWEDSGRLFALVD